MFIQQDLVEIASVKKLTNEGHVSTLSYCLCVFIGITRAVVTHILLERSKKICGLRFLEVELFGTSCPGATGAYA
jgi:hypothetical protein